jgi:ribonuclease P protein component
MRTINKKKEFVSTLQEGKSRAYNNFVVRYQRKGHSDVAFGFSLPRKLGGSVVRNRARRRLKAAVQTKEAEFPAGRYVFMARRHILRSGFQEIEEDLVKFFVEIEREQD